MPIPSGVITKQFVAPPGQGMTGEVGSVEVSILPTHPQGRIITHVASGVPLVSFFDVRRAPAGRAVILDLPVSDQPGFCDESQNPVQGWYYKITVRYLVDGRKVGVQTIKNLKVLTVSPAIINFDSIPTNAEANQFQGPPGKSAYDLAVQSGYTGSLNEWLASLGGGQAPGSPASFSTVVGDGQTTRFRIDHNLGKQDVHVLLTDAIAPYRVYIPESYNTSENSVILVFRKPPGLAAYKVYISAV